jgi:hypothetical protein
MPSPFPGMDPFLEHPDIFPDVHDSLTTYLREFLQTRLPEPYFAAIGRRIWVEVSRPYIGRDVHVLRPRQESPARRGTGPAVAVTVLEAAQPVLVRVLHDERREPFVEIFTRGEEGKRLVTSIEVLSLANKTPGEHGRELYLRKQSEILDSRVHLVEIDLLRGGQHATAVPRDLALEVAGPFDYHVSVHPFDSLEDYYVYPIWLGARLPVVAIPLLPGDPAVPIDLQAVFDRCYDAGPYRREIRYHADAIVPPLRPDQDEWARTLLDAARAERG